MANTPNLHHTMREVMDEATAALFLDVSVRTMQRLRLAREITFFRVRGQVRYRRSDLERYMSAHTEAALRTGTR